MQSGEKSSSSGHVFNGGEKVSVIFSPRRAFALLLCVQVLAAHKPILAATTVISWGDQTSVPPGLTNVAVIAAGLNHSLAVNADGTVVAWGDNSPGQTTVPPDLTNVVAVAGGLSHSLALVADGTLRVWGDNSVGEGVIPPGLSNVLAISVGYSHNLALQADGT